MIKKLAQAFCRTTGGMKKFVQKMQLLARIPEDKFEAKIAELCADPVEPQGAAQQAAVPAQQAAVPAQQADGVSQEIPTVGPERVNGDAPERRPGDEAAVPAQQAAVPEQANPRYLQSITVVTLFFAALLGFGLNHLLETEHTEKGSIIADHRWGFFFVAVFIFLRFLTGSANHLWLEYVSDPRDDRLKMDDVLFTWDLAWLTLLGCLGVAMCYSKEGYTFFIYTASLLLAALIWSILDWDFRRRQWRWAIGDWAPTWILLNAIQLGFVLCGLLAGYLESLGPGLLGSWLTALAMDRALGLRLLIVGFVSAVILAIDFYQQLRHLAEPPPPSPP